MILIVESGSTKADFVLINDKGKNILSSETFGLNPLFLSENQIQSAIEAEDALMKFKNDILKVYFFGAGCRSEKLNQKVQNAFQNLFIQAECHVESDLKAACLSVSYGNESLVGILGTGSNTCFFNSENIVQLRPSLGFILGDEGSGNHIGRALIKCYYAGLMPQELSKSFEESFKFNVGEILENVYQKPNANAFLASFVAFALTHKNHDFIKNLVKECFKSYFEIQVFPYESLKIKEINFVGSVAFLFQNILKEVAETFGYSVQCIVQKPMQSLVEIYSEQAKLLDNTKL